MLQLPASIMDDPYFGSDVPARRIKREVPVICIRNDTEYGWWWWRQGEVEEILRLDTRT